MPDDSQQPAAAEFRPATTSIPIPVATSHTLQQQPASASVPPPDLESTETVEVAPPIPDRLLFTPLIDIYETDEGLHLIADLPGVNANSLDLQVQDNKLTLFGRVAPVVPPEAQLLHKEYDEGDFLRSFILSDEVDHERISAKINAGILEIALPRAHKTQPRRIQVNSD